MSTDIHPDMPPRIRCETISPTSPHLACHRSHGTILHYPGSGLGHPLADDPAVLIGLALGHVRKGDCLTGTVPDAITDRLRALPITAIRPAACCSTGSQGATAILLPHLSRIRPSRIRPSLAPVAA